MIRRELAKDPKLATESWDRFLPQFRKRHLKTSEKTTKKNEVQQQKAEARKAAGLDLGGAKTNKPTKKVYTPFPPPQLPRKVTRFEFFFLLAWHSSGSHRLTCNLSLGSISSNRTRRRRVRRNGNKRRCVMHPVKWIPEHDLRFLSSIFYSKTRRRLNVGLSVLRHLSPR